MKKGIECDVDENQRCLENGASSSSTLSSSPSSVCQGESCCHHQKRTSERWLVLLVVNAIVTVILVVGLVAFYCQYQRDMAVVMQQCSPAASSSSSAAPIPAALQLVDQTREYEKDDSSEDDERTRRAQPKRKSSDRPGAFTPRQERTIKQLIKQECRCSSSPPPPAPPPATAAVIPPSPAPSEHMVGRTIHLVMKGSSNKANSVGVFDNFYVLSSSSWKSWHPFYKEIDGRLEVPEDGLYIVYGQMTYSDDKSMDTLIVERQPFNAQEATHEVVSCSSNINPMNERGAKTITCTFFTVTRLRHRDILQFIDKYARPESKSPRQFRIEHSNSFWGIMWMAL